MDTVTILRRLWRLKFLVVLVALLAVVAGIAVSYSYSPPLKLESRKYTVGVATARVLVDTPESQVVDVAPKGSDSTGARANLIATLMVDGEIKKLIAKRAGVDPKRLLGMSQAAADPVAAATAPTRDSYVLATQVTTISNGTWLPIIEIDTQGPDVAAAQKIADAAVAGLREYLDSKAAADAVPDAERLKVEGLGVAQARAETRGPRLLFSLIAMLVIFFGGCAAILVVSNIVRGLRTPEATPSAPAPAPAEAEEEPAQMDWSLTETWPSKLPVGDAENGSLRAPEPETDVEQRESTPSAPRSGSWWGGNPV